MAARSDQDKAGEQLRLRPDMVSFRLLVLDFVRGYIARWGDSPSQYEIASGLACSRTRVARAIHSLERSGLLQRRPGMRGLSVPLPAPAGGPNRILHRGEVLDYVPAGSSGGCNGS